MSDKDPEKEEDAKNREGETVKEVYAQKWWSNTQNTGTYGIKTQK